MNEVKNSYVLAFRGDIRDVATLVMVYEDKLGIRLRNKSTILRHAVADYASVLARSFKVEKFKTAHDAKAFLSQRGLLEVERSRLRTAKAMALESVELDETDLQTSEAVIPDEVLKLVEDEETRKRAEELTKGGDDE